MELPTNNVDWVTGFLLSDVNSIVSLSIFLFDSVGSSFHCFSWFEVVGFFRCTRLYFGFIVCWVCCLAMFSFSCTLLLGTLACDWFPVSLEIRFDGLFGCLQSPA